MMVIVPSRGRPHAVEELIQAWEDTRATATLFVAVNETDELIHEYAKVLRDSPRYVGWLRTPTDTMVSALNYAASRHSRKESIIGFMGDDHRPRTEHWDDIVREHFRINGPSIVYGNDLIHGPNLPTHAFLPGEFVKRVGHMSPPKLKHLYVDNYWKTLGEQTNSLAYRSEMIIEHMHPVAGKAEWDDGYRRVNNGAMYADDHFAFQEYVASDHFTTDIAIMENVRREWAE